MSGNVYAPAVVKLSGTVVDFGTMRQNTGNATGSLSLTNNNTGALTDSLVTAAGPMPTGITATTPGALASQQTGSIGFTLSTTTAGVVSGSGSLSFASHDSELSDLSLGSQGVTFEGTVTQLAEAALSKLSGSGTMTGGGTSYILDLGSFASGATGSADVGVMNTNSGLDFSELLGGSFAQSNGSGFTFTGSDLSGLVGGAPAVLGDIVGFDAAGLSNGLYSETVTFDGFSHYEGLTDQSLSPISVTIDATVTGGTGAVPEPSTWAMMLLGFSGLGLLARRHRRTAAGAA